METLIPVLIAGLVESARSSMELAAFTYHHTTILTSAVSEVSSQAPGDVIKGIVYNSGCRTAGFPRLL